MEDDGTGMDWETVTEVWMEPGTDFRSQQFAARRRTKKYNRLPLGEKGVGRFAAHKLGDDVTLITRQYHKPEVIVRVDWQRFQEARYIGDVDVDVHERTPEAFKGKDTGTRIEIRRLRETWTRAMVRRPPS